MFSAFFIDRPKFALVISVVISLAGLIALYVLPIETFPDVAPPQVQVTANYTGANATAVEQSVAAPIEDKVNGVDDMLYMSSDSNNDGSYTLTVTFDVGTNPDIAAVNVQNRVATATAQLPSEVTRSGVTTKKQSSSLLMAVVSSREVLRRSTEQNASRTLIHKRQSAPSCGAHAPAAERTIDRQGQTDESLTTMTGVREGLSS